MKLYFCEDFSPVLALTVAVALLSSFGSIVTSVTVRSASSLAYMPAVTAVAQLAPEFFAEICFASCAVICVLQIFAPS